MAGLILVSLLLMMLVTSIPRAAIKDNAVSIITQIHEEGPYPIVRNPILLLDHYTDCVMCNVLLSCDSCSLFQKSLLNPIQIFSRDKSIEETYQWAIGQKESTRQSKYGRYWHGYQVPLTLLLLVTDYNGIRLFNGILYYILLVWVMWLMTKRCGWQMSIAFLFAILITASPFIAPMSMQFFGCYAIMLIASIFILMRKHTSDRDFTVFLTIGACTAFIDLLTTPIITLGVPLACYISSHHPRHAMKTIVLFSFSWALGYATLWASKWIIATAITGENVIANALSTAHFRSTGNGTYLDIFNSFRFFLDNLLCKYDINLSNLFLVIIACVTILSIVFLTKRAWKPLKQQAWWLAISILPLVWYCLLPQHSTAHFFFTWRALLVTVFSLSAIVLYAIKPQKNEFKDL